MKYEVIHSFPAQQCISTAGISMPNSVFQCLTQDFWPLGDCWYHIPSPQKQKLKQVSVGRTSVFVLDKNGKDLINY